MDGGEERSRSSQVAERAIRVVLWVWIGLGGFFALMSGMVADGCSDQTCDTRVSSGWLVLMAAQAAVLAVGLKWGRRTHPRSIAVLAILAVLSASAIAIFFWYAGRYV